MSKTVSIQTDPSRRPLRINLDEFAAAVRALAIDPAEALIKPRWVDAGLFVVTDDKAVLTPRGEDLLASAEYIPDDPPPEAPKALSCSACGGTGEQALFVSKHPCDVCDGTGCAKEASAEQRSPAAYFTFDPVGAGMLGTDLARDAYVGWRTDGLPEIGRHVEVEVTCGERLRGEVIDVQAPFSGILLLASGNAAPAGYPGGRWTWQGPSASSDEYRTCWRYIDTVRCDEIWHIDGLPEIGRHVEVEVASGEVLRGVVEMVIPHNGTIRLQGPDSRPKEWRRPHDSGVWATGPRWHNECERRLRWRYAPSGHVASSSESR